MGGATGLPSDGRSARRARDRPLYRTLRHPRITPDGPVVSVGMEQTSAILS